MARTGKQLARPPGAPCQRHQPRPRLWRQLLSAREPHRDSLKNPKRRPASSRRPGVKSRAAQAGPRPSEHPRVHTVPSFLRQIQRSRGTSPDRARGTASRLDLALDGSLLPVVVGHLVKREQRAAAGQRVCEAELAEGGLHAAVTDAVVSQLV